MGKESGFLFLAAIAKELKRSYECPVILLTQKDYADNVYGSLIAMRTAVLQDASSQTVLDIVNTFHFEWLQAVQDVENFLKRVKTTPRESVFNSFDYTTECIENRCKYFHHYIIHLKEPLKSAELALLHEEIDIMKDMQEIYGSVLLQKQGSLANSADKAEFIGIIMDEIKELFNWLDKLYDNLALQLCKLLEAPQLPAKLSKEVQQVIQEMASLLSHEKIRTEKKQTSNSREKCLFHDIDIKKITEKIKTLEDRIAQLQEKKVSGGKLSIRHKAIFLEDRLESLENLKISLSFIKKKCTLHPDEESNAVKDEIQIFNHMMPHQMRCRLVEKLVQLWEIAIGDPETKSIITIMQTHEVKEVFSDDLGHFTVDHYGRKLYSKDNDDVIYQLDENNMLVPVDDDQHVYFYDECGRYYLTDKNVRVYKAYHSASEYVMHRNGMLLKMSETVAGINYHYNKLGRYYIDEYGDRIYCTHGSNEKYRSDGLGNLVKIREEPYKLTTCPVEPMVTEESLYLKSAVGEALKRCVAEVVMVLPEDPIRYLADRLVKYHFDMEFKKKQHSERQELMAEREQLKRLKEEGEEQFVEPEDSFEDQSGVDYNYMNYETIAE